MKNYIRILTIITALMLGAVSEAWAQLDNSDIEIDVKPSASTGTIGKSVDATTREVTLTITPASGYYIKASDIVVEKLVDPGKANAPKRRISEVTDVITGKMYSSSGRTDADIISSVAYPNSAQYVFTLPTDYDGAYVTATFHLQTEGDIIRITRSTNLGATPDMTAHYILAEDVSATVVGTLYSSTAFTGTFEGEAQVDGSFPKISDLTHALFQTVNGGTVKNIMFDNVNISGGTNAGTVCNEAIGDTRIYNCGVLATSSTTKTDENGYTYFTNCTSSVSGSNNVGGIVGLLDGTSRVINCFSYANVSGGSYVGGIVGYNNVATTATNLKTMVMNCMFYGEVSGSSIAPIYNGVKITNVGENTGVSNFNYFRLESTYIQNTGITKVYNCALGAETRFLQRFEFFRNLQNSHRELAAWWASTSTTPSPNVTKDEMAKWVLLPSQIGSSTPYPVLKAPGYYPSVVNIDAKNATTQAERNKGGKLGTLAVNIRMGSGARFDPPTGATIIKPYLTLNITDKDYDHFNFNYYKVQLPYYNDVGTKNYTGNRVVTGWKIVSITGGTPGTYTESDSWGGYNFADRNCTNKDLYGSGGSNRVFSQGAYWDVPEGVTAITIEPYWAKAAYLTDANADVVYNENMGTAYPVPNVGGGTIYTNKNSYPIAGDNQIVYTNLGDAVEDVLKPNTSHTVNDYAVVLVGNYHHVVSNNTAVSGSRPYTVTSVDLDGDDEPDYSLILRNNGRNTWHPVKWDFINIPGLGMAQKSTGANATGSYNLGIVVPKGWFETTNTSLFRVTQFEYSRKSSRSIAAPYILQGGVMEQWVTGQNNVSEDPMNTTYFHLGGNVWFKEFHRGTHQDNTGSTNHTPISVTGGDFDKFYLTGLYRADVTSYGDNAECYINGGRFGVVAGAAMEGIGKADGADDTGNITWQIQNADIKEFYGGGLNADRPVTGNISTTITGGKIDLFCGGPKFGDMSTGKTVTTTATGCEFGTFFGAGFGGSSYSRRAPRNITNMINMPATTGDSKSYDSWNAWVTAEYKQKSATNFPGISIRFDYQFIPNSGNADNVGRLFVEHVLFSLAKTYNVTSALTNCTITGNFYGGGSLGMVDGPVTSTLTDCTVNGNVFGAGYSASLPTVEVDSIGFRVEPYYYTDLGTYRTGVKGKTTTYKWAHGDEISINKTDGILYTTENLDGLGAVTGNVTLTINGNTIADENGKVMAVGKSVYGGGEESAVNGNTEVNVNGGTIGTDSSADDYGNVFGGGNLGIVEKNTTVTIGGGSVNQSVYGGGCEADVLGNTNVSMTDGYIFNGIFGGGLSGSVGTFTRSTDPADVNIFGHTAHTGCIGKPVSCEEGTGKCTIVVSGGQIGPIEVATQGMNRLDAQGGPVPEGWVWGAGRGLVEDPATHPDTHFTAYVNETDVTIKDNAFILESIIGGGEFGRVLGNTKVNIKGGQIGVGANQTEIVGGVLKPKRYTDDKFVDPSVTTITNDNVLTPCSHYQYGKSVGDIKVYDTYDPYADKYKQDHDGSLPTGLEGGSTDNASDGKTWIGCVFGGGSGYFPYKETDTNGKITDYGWVESAGWVEGNSEVRISGGHILSNVYGANEYTTVQGKSKVTMTGGTIGVPRTQAQIEASPKLGHLFGGGKGDPRPYFNNKTNAGSVEIDISGGIIYGSVFGGGESGTVKGGVAVNMTGGVVLSDVYGGGALADTQTSNWDASANSGAGDWAAGKSSASTTTTVRLKGGTILGDAYGGGLGETGKPAYVWGDVLVELNNDVDDDAKGCIVKGSIFGCNNMSGSPQGSTTVHIYKTQREGADRITNAAAEGEEGQPGYVPAVENAKVKGTKLGADYNPNSFDVKAVYGGGNMAAYEPVDLTTGTTNVIIEGCDRTSICQVYGGGNAACTPATKVTINGTFEIGELFGGGNGKDRIFVDNVYKPNPGANVGYRDYSEFYYEGGVWKVRDKAGADTKENRIANYQYGNGVASVNVFGGLVHRVFGGSNTKGNVRQTALTLLDENTGCTFCVDEAYGGGKSAPMDAEAKLLMACIPGLEAVYGGAEAADVHGNVTLNITNGTFDRVFGGNNISGTISGSITVNVEEVGCKPIKIGELYGGGNQAGYSIYGYKEVNKGTELAPNMVWVPRESADDDGIGPETPYEDPQVNVKSFTSIGNIYGGGYGDGATMVGNPTVNVNETYGRYYNNDVSVVGENEKISELYPIPSHAKGRMGAINNVFGGGNAAKVIGNTNVNIATLEEVYVVKEVNVGDDVTGLYTRSGAGTSASPFDYTDAEGTAQADTTYYEKKDVLGVDIRGNVFGGGNQAVVTGDSKVKIGKKNEGN